MLANAEGQTRQSIVTNHQVPRAHEFILCSRQPNLMVANNYCLAARTNRSPAITTANTARLAL